MFHKLILFVFLILSVRNLAHAQEPIVIDSLSRNITGENLSIYIPDKDVNLKQAMNATFQPSRQNIPNLGFQQKGVWLKFSILNNSFSSSLALTIGSNTLTEAVLYYQKSANSEYDSIVISNLLPLSHRRYRGADIIFRIDKIAESAQDYYLRIQSRQPIVVLLKVNLPADQLAQTVVKNWVNGIYFGMILIMSIYNFFLFLSIRERSYIYYVAFILTSGLTQLCLKGIAFQYFWPEVPSLEANSLVLFASLGGIFALLFTKYFLDIGEISKKWDNFLLLLTIPFCVSILLLFFNNFDSAFTLIQVATIISSITILVVAIFVVIKNKNSYAIYFLISSSFLIIGSIIFILKDFNLLPFNFITDYSVQISSAIQMTLLSFALANRINILKKEKELSRLNALRLARENERIVKRQNIDLEQKVLERTSELNQSLENLKQTQSKLVAAEKMSSLGQLTAGIAHEINNPINFVAGNIKPLKRDIYQLFEIMVVFEEIFSRDISVVEKQLALAQYKEEIDFDFLKLEIAQLLKGINEGASRTADIVKGLRSFSRHDDDEFTPSDINAGITTTLSISRNLMDNLEVDTVLADIPFVECHPGSLNQVFLNLITNAIFAIREKFGTDKGGQIKISTYRNGKFVHVIINDNGVGMSEETVSKLYEPFFTTKPVGLGTGLGMSIVFSLIKLHNGKLTVNSKLSIGTEINLRLFISPPPKLGSAT